MWEGVSTTFRTPFTGIIWAFRLCLQYFSLEFFIRHCDRQKTKLCRSLPKMIRHDRLSDGHSHRLQMQTYQHALSANQKSILQTVLILCLGLTYVLYFCRQWRKCSSHEVNTVGRCCRVYSQVCCAIHSRKRPTGLYSFNMWFSM